MESLAMRPRCSLAVVDQYDSAVQLANLVIANCGAALRGADECVRPYVGLQALGCHQVDQIADTAGVAPLVVIPRDHLDAVAADHQGHGRVDDGGAGIPFKIGRDQFVFLEPEIAFQRTRLGGFFQGSIDFLFGRLFFNPDDEVDNRDIGRGHAYRETVEFAGQIGDDELKRFGCAGRGWDHVDRCRTGSPQIFVREVEDHLIVRIGVDSGHGAADDLEIVVDDFGDRGKTIRGAGSVRNDVVLRGIILLFVYAEHDGEVFILRGGGDDDFLHAAAQMFLSVSGVGEPAGGFNDDLGSDGIPWQGGGVFLFEDLNDFAVDRNTVGAGGDFVRQVAEDGIVLEQVG